MRLTIWGCRGSVPTPGPDTVRYGGNTSCVEVSLDNGTNLVLDAGTGIRRLGFDLLDRGARRVHLLLTHLHLDHLEGLRFFAPLWDERVTLDIWGPPSPLLSLRERISRSFSPPLFPIDLREVPARVTFHDVPRQPWTVDGARLLADLVAHPGPTVGFRIETVTSSFAYLPDHEPALAGTIADRSRDWISGAAIADDVDILLHDAQYFEDEYEERIGWGHSSVSDAVAFARAVGARRLILFHHEPRHTDVSLERLEARARSLVGGNEDWPALAREGMVVELP
ncbi:MAG TPA: MBL fold metallo-hydrolase [Gaiellaceae bacterium]|jgi:phosphoribosyl 1,2-cyclic phosphodiesterase|nr:MBL fold metallo-hydrolase [Gaiellaceae bacterium]